MNDYDFTGMTDLELVKLQAEMRKSPFPEDRAFLDAILKELGKRQRKHEAGAPEATLETE
jgi:hypothetical protein